MKKALFITTLFAVVNLAHADILSLQLSGGEFAYSVSGTVRDSSVSSDTFDLKNDLGIKNDHAFQGFVYFRHPLPIIPNIRLGETSLKLSGAGTITQTVTFNNTKFLQSDNVKTTADLSHTDIGVYWNLWDTGFRLDLGLNTKTFDGKVTLNDTTTPSLSATTTFHKTVPLLYGAVGLPIPGTGISFDGDISTISASGDSLTDYLVRVKYQTSFGLGVALGYRSLSFKYVNGTQNFNLHIKGPYLNGTFKF